MKNSSGRKKISPVVVVETKVEETEQNDTFNYEKET